RVSRLLAGYRDRPAAKLDAIGDVLVALSQMLVDLPELAELDINPLWADADGVVALDARLRLSRAAPAGAEHFAILPYPAELTEQVDWHGEPLVLRAIRPEDEPQHRAFIEQLQPQDLRLRFFNARRDLPRSELARLVQIDYAREMAFIAVRTRPDGARETIGVVRSVIDPDNIEAEFAIIVRSDLKGQGLGHLLMRKMVKFQRQCGTQRLVGDVLHENRVMRDLVTWHGFTVDGAASNADALRFVLDLQENRR
ncbi:MAG TPA: GNAT family N-acetyltransferase, partial [Burkholderiaceae bacterium]|nr:GNAT family N-acetyltransferase [Burkholderiaceae bacterium]